MSKKIKVWDVQQRVNGEWVSIYGTPFNNWKEAKLVLDEALMSQEMMNEDNPIRLIEIDE